MDWFKGNFTGKHQIWWEIPWFPVNFPLNQSIETSSQVGWKISTTWNQPVVSCCGSNLRTPPKKKLQTTDDPLLVVIVYLCVYLYIYIVIVIYIYCIYIYQYIYTVYIYTVYIYISPIFWYYKWWVIPTYVLSKTQFHNCGTVIHSKPWCLLDLLHCLQRQNRSLLLVIWNFTLW